MLSGRRLWIGLALALLTVPSVMLGPGSARGGTGGGHQVGPITGLLPDGRLLTPFGDMVDLRGNFSHGAALTPDGRFLWAVQAGEAYNDVRIVSLRSRRIVEILRLPGSSGGVAISPNGRHAYVSGEPDATERPGGDTPPGTPGRNGDVIHVYNIDRVTGKARQTGVISVAPPSGTRPPQDFPPTRTAPESWPQDIAVSPDGSTLLVALNLADRAAVIDLPTRTVRFVQTGSYPYGAAIVGSGRTGLISNEGPGTVSVIDLRSARKISDVTVGPPLSHPEGIAVDRASHRAFVALANVDRIAVLNTVSNKVIASLSVGRAAGLGESPVAESVTPDSKRLLVADAGGDDVAVFALPALGGGPRSRGGGRGVGGYRLLGRVPTADYPVAAFATRAGLLPCQRRAKPHNGGQRSVPHRCAKLAWVSGKGLGLGPNTVPRDPRYLDNAERQMGTVGIGDFPSAAELRRLTAAANRQIRPRGSSAPPVNTPVRPHGPIKYVFYFVRENRNYDQVLGDLHRGDGDPRLAIFGRQITPNMHALAGRFGTLDRVFADSEVSIDGHMWTSGAQASDFVERNSGPSNAGRNYPYDFVYSIAQPDGAFIFDQATRDHVSYMNFGEGIASLLPIPDKDRTPQGTQAASSKYAHSDLGPPNGCYPADAYIGTDPITHQFTFDSTIPPGGPPTSESRFECFKRKFDEQVATSSVPTFTYLTTVDDHTQGTKPGDRTPAAMVASSDWALGEFVDLISHSRIWPHTAIFVVEDDSQEGLDHVDAHRIPAFVISPYSRPYTVVSARYDQLSVLRTIEIITGIAPLGLGDALATPMYGAFQPTPNLTPYRQIVPHVNMFALNTMASADARLSAALDFSQLDRVPQRTLDRILWHAMRGEHSRVPPVGPNASPPGGG